LNADLADQADSADFYMNIRPYPHNPLYLRSKVRLNHYNAAFSNSLSIKQKFLHEHDRRIELIILIVLFAEAVAFVVRS
jgi:hypothetical protein